MRWTTPLLCLLVLLAAPAAGIDLAYPDPGDTVVEVDLIDDAGQSVDWRLEVPAAMAEGKCLSTLPRQEDAQSASAVLTLGTGDDAVVQMVSLLRNVEKHEVKDEEGNTVRDDDGQPVIEDRVVFTGSLSVNKPELTVGDWAMGLTVRDNQGEAYDCGDARELDVEADGDDAPPVVAFPTAKAGVVRLGAHQSLAAEVTDATLGRVEYRVDRMPPGAFFALKAPFVIPSQSFFPGDNELTIRATDRAGHATTQQTVTVSVDGEAPVLEVDLLNRTVFFDGVSNPIVVNVTDESDYRVTVSFQGEDVVREGPAGNSSFLVGVPANGTGESLLQVRVVDAFGNRAAFTRLLSVTQLTTDARIDEVEQDDARVVVGEDVRIHVSMEQPTSVADVVFDLLVDGERLGEMEVPSRGDNRTTLSVKLPPGRQELTVRAVAPDGVLHDERNLTAKVPVEVYLARVVVGDDEYHVRSTPQGLPDGVVAPNGTVLETEMVERGSNVVYAFEADGETYHWDPTRPSVQEFQEAEDVDGGGEDSPGPGAVLLLAVLAAAAVALRRR